MTHFSSFPSALRVCLLLALFWLALRLPAAAQAPAWQLARAVAAATAGATTNGSSVSATAVDAAGNIILAGSFANTVTLGSITLTSVGSADVFVAKFNPATNQYVWAVRAGGTGRESIAALAVSGSSVYVAGAFTGPTLEWGATTLTNAGAGYEDAFVAKLTDAGATGSFGWGLRAGGFAYEIATGLAVNGSSVYMTGYFSSPTVSFGATTLTKAGNFEVFVAKLTDAGPTGGFVWAQRAGGTGGGTITEAFALAVSGSSVYVAGYFQGLTAVFGPAALTNSGANNSREVFVAKLTDAGPTGNFVWAQRAGSTGSDVAFALAASGPNVYVTGYLFSPDAGVSPATADFGPLTLTNARGVALFVAKLTDAGPTGSFAWVQQAPGSATGSALAVSGASVYVAGYFDGAVANFGSTALTNAGLSDIFVAKLTDAGSTGSFAWAQQAGGTGYDQVTELLVSGNSVYAAGSFASPTIAFGPTTLTNPDANPGAIPINLGFLATLTDPTLTATATGRALPSAPLFPNPAHGTATLRLPAGTAPAPLTLTDGLGRTVRRYAAPAGPAEAVLDLRGLPAGLYLLRGAGAAQRLVVE